MSGCHCLCAVNHPTPEGRADGRCTGAEDTRLMFDSQLTGRVAVPMCSPCAAATLAATQDAWQRA